MLVQIFWVVFLLFIWFNTDAFIYYSELFRLNSLFKVDLWKKYRIESNPKITYLEFIHLRYKNFFSKLISCRPCLAFWFTLIITLIYSSWGYFPMIYIISYIIYKLINKYE